MNDPRDPRTPPPDDGELLSAWLAGDLDEAQAERVEQRLAAEPQLAAQLDATVDLLVVLGGLDQIDPPPDYPRRLRARLEAERQALPHPGQARLEPADSPLVPLQAIGDHRPRQRSGKSAGPRPARQREQRSRFLRWPAVAALLLVLGVVVALPLLRPSPTFDAAQEEVGVAAEDSAPSPPGPPAVDEQLQPPVVVEDSVAERLQSLDEDAPESAGGDASVEADQEGGDTDGIRERFATVPEATDLLDRRVGEATTTAARYTAAIEGAPAFSTGTEPAACLDVVTGGEAESVPVRVEAFSYQGRAALAYVVVKASEGADVLDRIEVWVVDPDTCDPEAFVAA